MWTERFRYAAQVVITLALALIVGAVIMQVSGKDAWNAYSVLFQSALGSGRAIANTLLAATPLILTGLATVIAFRAGIFNVGVEGSLYIGAFAAAWVGPCSNCSSAAASCSGGSAPCRVASGWAG